MPTDWNPPAVHLARLAPGSVRTMRDALHRISGLLTSGQDDAFDVAWSAVPYQHAQAVRAASAARCARAGCSKHLAALRGVVQEAWRLGLMSGEDHHRAADVQSVRGETLRAGRALNAGELRALFAVCAAGDSPAGARNAALLAVLYGGGLRRSEAPALDLADHDAETGALTVRAGKGRKARVGYATNGGAVSLGAWLRARATEAGAMFCPVNKAERVEVRGMTDQAVLLIVRPRAVQAGFRRLSPHEPRRTFVSDLLDARRHLGGQRLAGHANVHSAARDDRRGEAAKRRAAELPHVPFVAG